MAYTQPINPRFSMMSVGTPTSDNFSPASSSTRFSLPGPTNPTTTSAPLKASNRSFIYDRQLNKTRTAEVSLSAYAFLFSEIIQYTQKRVNGIGDLERRCVRFVCVMSISLRMSTLRQAQCSRLSNRHAGARAHGLARRSVVKSAKTRDPFPSSVDVNTYTSLACRVRKACRRD